MPEFLIEHNESMEKETSKLCKDFAKSLYGSLGKRFSNKELISNFKIFSTNKIRETKNENLATFGRDEMELLIQHYDFEKYYLTTTFPAQINLETVRNEWRNLKHILKTSSLNTKDEELWPIIFFNLKEKYPSITTLILLKGILPFITVDCERGFSTINFIKNEHRNKVRYNIDISIFKFYQEKKIWIYL